MKTDSSIIYAAYGEHPALYVTEGEIPSGIERAKFKDCKKAILSMNNHQIMFFHDYTGISELQEISMHNIVLEKRDSAVAYIKGSYNQNTNCYGYGMVFISAGGVEEYSGKNYDKYGMRFISGEFEAAEMAVIRAMCLGIKKLTIISDYIGVEKIATGEWSGNQPGTEAYQKVMEDAGLYVWLQFDKVKPYMKIIANDRAKVLAEEVHRSN